MRPRLVDHLRPESWTHRHTSLGAHCDLDITRRTLCPRSHETRAPMASTREIGTHPRLACYYIDARDWHASKSGCRHVRLEMRLVACAQVSKCVVCPRHWCVTRTRDTRQWRRLAPRRAMRPRLDRLLSVVQVLDITTRPFRVYKTLARDAPSRRHRTRRRATRSNVYESTTPRP